jgi:hypothetical protein
VNIIKVPQSFQPKFAKYKGRALEWCRQHWKLSEYDWILHLDEETQIDEYLVQACLDFIERGTEDFGLVCATSTSPLGERKLILLKGDNLFYHPQLLEKLFPDHS